MLFHGGVSPCSLNYDLDNRISAEVRRLFNSYTRIDHSSHRMSLGYNDSERADMLLKRISGKRLTYRRINEAARNSEGNTH
jgi:hypothetical protein